MAEDVILERGDSKIKKKRGIRTRFSQYGAAAYRCMGENDGERLFLEKGIGLELKF